MPVVVVDDDDDDDDDVVMVLTIEHVHILDDSKDSSFLAEVEEEQVSLYHTLHIFLPWTYC